MGKFTLQIAVALFTLMIKQIVGWVGICHLVGHRASRGWDRQAVLADLRRWRDRTLDRCGAFDEVRMRRLVSQVNRLTCRLGWSGLFTPEYVLVPSGRSTEGRNCFALYRQPPLRWGRTTNPHFRA